MDDLTTIIGGHVSAIVYRGQLVSLQRNGIEFMHGAGLPESLKTAQDRKGWDNSDLTMFPVIGKPKDFKITTDKRTYDMDGNGISRLLPFFTKQQLSDDIVVMQQTYDGSPVKNPKYDPTEKDSPENLQWMPYSITQSVIALDDGVSIYTVLKNLDEKDNMPFTLGKHPAFRLQGRVEDALFGFEGFDGRISLEDMMRESGGRAYKKAGTNCVCYYDSILNRGVEVSSDCFNNFMVWTKSLDSGMFCIEPVTYLPDSEEQYFIDAPHDLLRSEEQRIYPMKIRLLG